MLTANHFSIKYYHNNVTVINSVTYGGAKLSLIIFLQHYRVNAYEQF
jgi:hypothetical protein